MAEMESVIDVGILDVVGFVGYSRVDSMMERSVECLRYERYMPEVPRVKLGGVFEITPEVLMVLACFNMRGTDNGFLWEYARQFLPWTKIVVRGVTYDVETEAVRTSRRAWSEVCPMVYHWTRHVQVSRAWTALDTVGAWMERARKAGVDPAEVYGVTDGVEMEVEVNRLFATLM